MEKRYACIMCSSHNMLTDEQMAAKVACIVCTSDLGFMLVEEVPTRLPR